MSEKLSKSEFMAAAAERKKAEEEPATQGASDPGKDIDFSNVTEELKEIDFSDPIAGVDFSDPLNGIKFEKPKS